MLLYKINTFWVVSMREMGFVMDSFACFSVAWECATSKCANAGLSSHFVEET